MRPAPRRPALRAAAAADVGTRATVRVTSSRPLSGDDAAATSRVRPPTSFGVRSFVRSALLTYSADVSVPRLAGFSLGRHHLPLTIAAPQARAEGGDGSRRQAAQALRLVALCFP